MLEIIAPMKKGSQRARSGNKLSMAAARDMPCSSDEGGEASGWRIREENNEIVIFGERAAHDSISANVKTPPN